MYLMYVDESGDCGLINSPTRYFILSAIIVHETRWLTLLDEIINFRRSLKQSKGLLMKEEIHASQFVSKRIKLRNNISPSNRIDILRQCLDWIASQAYVSIITVRIDKNSGTTADPFISAWTTLLQRFENTLSHQNFPTPAFVTDGGIVIADDTDVKKLTGLLRKMRRINHVPNMASYGQGSRNMPLQLVVKDPIYRSSADSYILQMADVIAYFAKQYYDPAKAIRRKGGKAWYGKLAGIINPFVTYSTVDFKMIRQ